MLKVVFLLQLVTCPVCGVEVILARINQHLDTACVSGQGSSRNDENNDENDDDTSYPTAAVTPQSGQTSKGPAHSGNASRQLHRVVLIQSPKCIVAFGFFMQ